MRALVTGANGFLGRHVVAALLARDIDVRAIVRPAASLEALGWPSSVEVFRADLRSSRELGRAFEGVDVLLHLAAVVSGGEDAQFAGTVVGTVNFTGLLTALGNDFEMQGHTIVMPYATQNSVNRIGLWNYPKGGILRRRLHKVDGLQAITLSY